VEEQEQEQVQKAVLALRRTRDTDKEGEEDDKEDDKEDKEEIDATLDYSLPDADTTGARERRAEAERDVGEARSTSTSRRRWTRSTSRRTSRTSGRSRTSSRSSSRSTSSGHPRCVAANGRAPSEAIRRRAHRKVADGTAGRAPPTPRPQRPLYSLRRLEQPDERPEQLPQPLENAGAVPATTTRRPPNTRNSAHRAQLDPTTKRTRDEGRTTRRRPWSITPATGIDGGLQRFPATGRRSAEQTADDPGGATSTVPSRTTPPA